MRLETPLYTGQGIGIGIRLGIVDESTLKLDRFSTTVTVLGTSTGNYIESKSPSPLMYQQHETILVQVTYTYVLYRRQVYISMHFVT